MALRAGIGWGDIVTMPIHAILAILGAADRDRRRRQRMFNKEMRRHKKHSQVVVDLATLYGD